MKHLAKVTVFLVASFLLSAGVTGELRAQSSASGHQYDTFATQTSGRSVAEFITADGRFDLAAVQASGYEGPLDMNGRELEQAPGSGVPILRSPSSEAQANHPDDIYWASGFELRGVKQEIMCMAIYDNKLIVAGILYQAGSSLVTNIAAWDGSSWSALGSGLNDLVWCLAVYDGKLIAGGPFTEAGGVAVDGIAAWNGTSWSAVGSWSAAGRSIGDMTIYDGKLVVIGNFTTGDGAVGDYIASWNGTSWSALGTGLDDQAGALTVYGTDLIVGGWFTQAGGNSANRLASWNGTSWSDMGWGLTTYEYIFGLAVYDGDLIVSGDFVSAGGVTGADDIAAWNGATWSAMGTNVGGSDLLFVFSGQLITNYYDSLMAWNGLSWSPFAIPTDGGIASLVDFNGDAIAGGNFTMAGDTVAYSVALWNGTAWEPLGTGNGVNDAGVGSFCSIPGTLYAGGGFGKAGDVDAKWIAAWDGTKWSALGNVTNGSVDDIIEFDGTIIAAGPTFITPGGDSIRGVASWDGSSWAPLGSGSDGNVYCLEVYDNKLIAAGQFTTIGGVTADKIAAWDGVTWAPLGSGANQLPLDLDIYDNKLIAAGNFTTIGGVSANRIAAWDGASWAALGSGINGQVAALAVYNGNLYAGGSTFTTAGGVSARHIAAWNGSSWSAMGTGMDSAVACLSVHSGTLIAAGNFTTAGGVSANRIASWNGSTWSPLGSGITSDWSTAYALATFDNTLFVGGGFRVVGGKVSNGIAQWTKPLNNYSVTSLDDAGTGTLRDVIGLVNADPDADTIVFDVSGTITLASPLPALTDDGTAIRGGTAPGGYRSVILDGQGTISVGLDISSRGNSVRNLVLTNFDAYAIRINDDSNEITGCHLNLNAAGTTRGTAGGGVEINASAHNIIGGCSELARNVIAGGGGNAGIRLTGPGADSNTIEGNFIGLGATGTDRLTNPIASESGILLFSAIGNTIGGDDAGCRNVISGNQLGIQMNSCRATSIKNNFIGLSATGLDSIPNEEGIALQGNSRQNLIGGPSPTRNYISGNRQNGISLSGAGADSNYIFGNLIGLDTTGGRAIGNRLNGIYLTSGPNENRIGWDLAGTVMNFIAGNGQNGVLIYANSNANMIATNYIGVGLTSDSVGNGYSGVSIDMSSSGNLVEMNTIAYNGRNGIEVLNAASTGNVFQWQRIFKNGLLAIDLGGDGVTVNDPGDGDIGPNNLVNYPELDSIITNPDLSFTLYGRASAGGTVDIYLAHPSGDDTRPADPSGHGEAYNYCLGVYVADPSGYFSCTLAGVPSPFSVISLTNTSSDGTSEMSPNYALNPGPMIIVATAYNPNKTGEAKTMQNGINIIVTDPVQLQFGKDAANNPITGIPGASYYDTPNDSIVIPTPVKGDYRIDIVAEEGGSSNSVYSSIIKVDGTQQMTIIVGEDIPGTGQVDSYGYTYDEEFHYVNGDANGDAQANVGDAVFLINYVFKGGPAPDPLAAGDANCDGDVNVADAVYLINFVFKGGPAPCYFEP